MGCPILKPLKRSYIKSNEAIIHFELQLYYLLMSWLEADSVQFYSRQKNGLANIKSCIDFTLGLIQLIYNFCHLYVYPDVRGYRGRETYVSFKTSSFQNFIWLAQSRQLHQWKGCENDSLVLLGVKDMHVQIFRPVQLVV